MSDLDEAWAVVAGEDATVYLFGPGKEQKGILRAEVVGKLDHDMVRVSSRGLAWDWPWPKATHASQDVPVGALIEVHENECFASLEAAVAFLRNREREHTLLLQRELTRLDEQIGELVEARAGIKRALVACSAEIDWDSGILPARIDP